MRAINTLASITSAVRFAVARFVHWLGVALPMFARRVAPVAIAIAGLVLAMDGQWTTARTAAAQPVAADLPRRTSSPATLASTDATTASDTRTGGDGTGTNAAGRKRKLGGGKLNLNSATAEQLVLLPTVGPAKAERVITWRKKNGGFKRIADIRRVKGFGYKTFKRLEPYLDIAGPTTLTTQ